MHNEIVIKYAGGWAGVGLGLNYTVTVTSFQFECNYLCDILCDGYKKQWAFSCTTFCIKHSDWLFSVL